MPGVEPDQARRCVVVLYVVVQQHPGPHAPEAVRLAAVMLLVLGQAPGDCQPPGAGGDQGRADLLHPTPGDHCFFSSCWAYSRARPTASCATTTAWCSRSG